ncbi:AraC family transcriptional regulator [Kluyvera intermedia]|uniref:Helix-turn-helix domain-containing protein n=1 Tax=Kluyvera intermedia TaxID=61648 RepID=A0ABX6DRS9_KLUIN|nr:AraC family transcriptional regulator [Kluyvera intermedia]QGH30484.1 helix-turn-helix domain-containing protein [Kluyvera intermedia]QGH39466.1 helix-turn-helix domain-containing protein [Kluyvera intermedia]WQD28086.1 AraC family transcriptional regulator [Kluyvera intermedia]VDZ83637.1 L-rhamnose operon regulatory protein rhaS [Kluyvera intermedia]
MNSWEPGRLEACRAELVELIAQAQPDEGQVEVRPGLYLNRISSPHYAVHGILEPSCCVVAEGSKEVILGGESFHYGAAHYLIATMGVPAFARIVNASPEKPYLSMRFLLDPAIVTSVILDSGIIRQHGKSSGGAKAVDVGVLGVDMLDAALRLVRASKSADEYRVLSPLIFRELVYRLLTSSQTTRLNQLARFGGQDHRMVRAVKILSDQYTQPLRIETIAHQLGMSISGFHAHFKAATNMSPVQFQKQLRLQEAQRLMLSEGFDAGQAAYRVGYEDQSHFSRDYKRQYGEPPARDIARLREITVQSMNV